MNNVMMVICGASGDLTKRKLIPALYRLIVFKKLQSWCVIGVGREAISVREIFDRARPYVASIDETVWGQLQDHFLYRSMDVTNDHDMHELSEYIAQAEERYQLAGNRLIYLALASQLFSVVTRQLLTHNIIRAKSETCRPWHRVVYEKPFGHDLQSAQQINASIQERLHENQIYRIDHYLTKELVSNIALVRFTNCVFEPLWNNRYIDQVEIILSETHDLRGRAVYYDSYGAVRDVVQNHMLAILALIAMESPEKLTGEYIRNERVRVLEKFSFIDGIYGQYVGYAQEQGVKKDSQTETFALLYGQIYNPRWAGVPFYFKTGKALDRHETVIHIKFKQVDCLLTKPCPSQTNVLTIRVFPDATFSLQLNVKKPGAVQEVVPVKMEFCHSCLFYDELPNAHEVLLEEVIRGQTSVSIRVDEIECTWRIIDGLREQNISMGYYEKHSQGPKEMYDFMNKYGIRWRT